MLVPVVVWPAVYCKMCIRPQMQRTETIEPAWLTANLGY